jgi:tetratricopeptide (TPR) repeat protein
MRDQGDTHESHIDGLDERFLIGIDLMQAGRIDKAAELFRSILKAEPRLAEPRLELARILMDTRQLDEAGEHAAMAVGILESGGQWTDDLPENVVLSAAYGLLGEIRRRQANADEVVFGNPEAWSALMDEAKAAFARAHSLDPDNEHADDWAEGLPESPTE